MKRSYQKIRRSSHDNHTDGTEPTAAAHWRADPEAAGQGPRQPLRHTRHEPERRRRLPEDDPRGRGRGTAGQADRV